MKIYYTKEEEKKFEAFRKEMYVKLVNESMGRDVSWGWNVIDDFSSKEFYRSLHTGNDENFCFSINFLREIGIDKINSFGKLTAYELFKTLIFDYITTNNVQKKTIIEKTVSEFRLLIDEDTNNKGFSFKDKNGEAVYITPENFKEILN